jgi:hypothetical protein
MSGEVARRSSSHEKNTTSSNNVETSRGDGASISANERVMSSGPVVNSRNAS